MARQLWLLRHGDAEPHGTRADAERRLTERGEGQARAAGIALERLQVGFDVVLFSPKTRARQTAELAAERWSVQPLAGDFDARQALAELAGLGADGRLLLVGHEPDLSSIARDLTGAKPDLKKGGLAVLRLEGRAPRLGNDGVVGELAVLLRPRELALIAGGMGGVPVDGD